MAKSEKLAAVAEQDGQTLGEWVREVLLEPAERRKRSVFVDGPLDETLTRRTILLNALSRPTAEGIRAGPPF